MLGIFGVTFMELSSQKITTVAVRQQATFCLELVKFVTKSDALLKKREIVDIFQAEISDRAVDMAGRLLECRFSLHKFSWGFFT